MARTKKTTRKVSIEELNKDIPPQPVEPPGKTTSRTEPSGKTTSRTKTSEKTKKPPTKGIIRLSQLQATMEADDLNCPLLTAGPSPELKGAIFSTFTWHWLRSFVSLGKGKTIEAEDLYDLNPKEGTQYCEKLWNDAIEKVRCTSNEHAALRVWRLLWLCFGLEYARAATFKAFWLICCILQVCFVFGFQHPLS
ncbi:hypothetical protein L7F22_059756 [Adiantum nelumboides]|nr:hypothetical protein [Adiantum nelumboides]